MPCPYPNALAPQSKTAIRNPPDGRSTRANLPLSQRPQVLRPQDRLSPLQAAIDGHRQPLLVLRERPSQRKLVRSAVGPEHAIGDTLVARRFHLQHAGLNRE